MAILKCKMCGGNLELTEGISVVECEYCGTNQTVPNADDDKKMNLFARANRLRFACEFDKAAGIYESILADFPEEAEGYWGLVLCKYGIEYVDDPATAKKVPTCHRSSFDSIMDDPDFVQAMENADAVARSVYRNEAKQIEEIRKGIIEVSSKEEPYDIFICYKETAEDGQRTIDSVLAQDVYDVLTDKGYRTFFARITLEDKLGQEYEPYIFAALNSAKVMLAFGTDYEYFNAVWVKNEWSRYLKLMEKDKGKHLIPCYKGIDAYDIPKEFVRLQAQDLGKVGAVQDLVRGIEKLIGAKKLSENAQPVVVQQTGPDCESLLKRAFIFLEDKDWKSADEYCEKVLDIDPENEQAYLGKLMASLRVSKKENLTNCENSFRNDANYQKVCRYGDKELIAELEKYNQQIDERNENRRLQQAYEQAAKLMRGAVSEGDYKKAAQEFEKIPQYRDAKEKAKECLEKAEITRKDQILSNTKKMMTGTTLIRDYENAIRGLQSIAGWKNADELVVEAKKKIEEIKERERQAQIARKEAERKAEEERKERERLAEIARKEAERKAEEERKERERLAAETAKRNKKIAMIVTPIVCIVIGVIIFVNTVVVPKNKYNDAMALMEAGKYQEAITAFEELGDYEDSAEKINECHEGLSNAQYEKAIALMEEGKYQEALLAFEELGDYKDSVGKINECYEGISNVQYEEAIALMEAGKYQEAIVVFDGLEEYKESAEKKERCKYEAIKGAKVGEYVFFGSYEQDMEPSNGKEDIEWKVLDIKDGKALLLSKYGIDVQKYNEEKKTVTWETCTLRTWLNDTFLNVAFTEKEKAAIPTVTIFPDKNLLNGPNPENQTRDQIFLLSIADVNVYFSLNDKRVCEATAYAKKQGARVSDKGASWWWLRSPGLDKTYADTVNDVGLDDEVGSVVDIGGVVRPALWIDLNSVTF